jgi:hypothetical protein
VLTKLWSRFRAWLDRKGYWSTVYHVEHVADLPDALKRDKLYVIGDDGYDWSAAMLCPGGCGKTLEMNLLPDAKPVWQVSKEAGGAATLKPSVWLKTGCACHFVLKKGRVRWV